MKKILMASMILSLVGCSDVGLVSQKLQEKTKVTRKAGAFSSSLADCVAETLQKQLSKEQFAAYVKRVQAAKPDQESTDIEDMISLVGPAEDKCRAK